jgi:hypothetical protein
LPGLFPAYGCLLFSFLCFGCARSTPSRRSVAQGRLRAWACGARLLSFAQLTPPLSLARPFFEKNGFRFAQAGLKPCPTRKCRAFCALSSGGPEERLKLRLFQSRRAASLRRNHSRRKTHTAEGGCATRVARWETGVLLVHMLRRQNQSARSLTPAHALMNARVRRRGFGMMNLNLSRENSLMRHGYNTHPRGSSLAVAGAPAAIGMTEGVRTAGNGNWIGN